MAQYSEKQVEQALTHEVRRRGGICWKFTSPGTAGVPDRIVILEGKVGFVELKAPGRIPRPQQEYRLNQIRQQGVLAVVIDHPDRIGGFLDSF